MVQADAKSLQPDFRFSLHLGPGGNITKSLLGSRDIGFMSGESKVRGGIVRALYIRKKSIALPRWLTYNDSTSVREDPQMSATYVS